MPNARRLPEVHQDLHGLARIIQLGAEIHALRNAGFDYERIAGLMSLGVPSCYTYHNTYARHARTQQAQQRESRHSSGF